MIPESQIVDNAALITARNRLHVIIARNLILCIFALLVILLFKVEISNLIWPSNEAKNTKAISNFMVSALSGDKVASEKLSEAVLSSELDLSDQNLSHSQRLQTIADYLNPDTRDTSNKDVSNISPAIDDGSIEAGAAAKQLTPINIVEKTPFSEPFSTPATEPDPAKLIAVEKSNNVKKASPMRKRLLLRTSADEGSYVISSVDSIKRLKVIENANGWAEVSSRDGIPVWVHKRSIEKYLNGFARITAKEVSAYSAPSTIESAVVGVLEKDDVLQLIRIQGDWYRVWSPISFTAWVNLGNT